MHIDGTISEWLGTTFGCDFDDLRLCDGTPVASTEGELSASEESGGESDA